MRDFITIRGDTQRAFAKQQIDLAPEGHVVRITEGNRSLEQNAKLWPSLQDVSRQVVWHGSRLSPDDRVMILAPIVRGRKGEFKKEMEKLAQKVVSEGLSVRATEELVSLHDGIRQAKPKARASRSER